jgi:GMP synthase-like glutamine amidotransferase
VDGHSEAERRDHESGEPDLGEVRTRQPKEGGYIQQSGRTTPWKMRVAVVQHDPSEPAGLLDELLAARSLPVETVPLYETGEIPPRTGDAALVLMGGPMSVNDVDEYPWLNAEKALVRRAVDGGRPVLGICLGAQLIASALGARVYPSTPETGWTTLAGTPGNPLFPPSFRAFELHGETFDLPPGARLLATGDRVRHQAFAVGSALGLQFHLEATPAMIAAWTTGLARTLADCQSTGTVQYAGDARRLCARVLDYVLRP